MKSQTLYLRLLLCLTALMAVLGLARPARAEVPDGDLIWTSTPDGIIVQVGRNTSDRTVIRRLSDKYERLTGQKLTPEIIQAVNPLVTWAACTKPPPGGRSRSKGDISAWTGCDTKDRYVILIAGSSGKIRIPATLVETNPERDAYLAELSGKAKANDAKGVLSLVEKHENQFKQPNAPPVALTLPPAVAEPKSQQPPATESCDQDCLLKKLIKTGWKPPVAATPEADQAGLLQLVAVLLAGLVAGAVLASMYYKRGGLTRQQKLRLTQRVVDAEAEAQRARDRINDVIRDADNRVMASGSKYEREMRKERAEAAADMNRLDSLLRKFADEYRIQTLESEGRPSSFEEIIIRLRLNAEARRSITELVYKELGVENYVVADIPSDLVKQVKRVLAEKDELIYDLRRDTSQADEATAKVEEYEKKLTELQEANTSLVEEVSKRDVVMGDLSNMARSYESAATEANTQLAKVSAELKAYKDEDKQWHDIIALCFSQTHMVASIQSGCESLREQIGQIKQHLGGYPTKRSRMRLSEDLEKKEKLLKAQEAALVEQTASLHDTEERMRRYTTEIFEKRTRLPIGDKTFDDYQVKRVSHTERMHGEASGKLKTIAALESQLIGHEEDLDLQTNLHVQTYHERDKLKIENETLVTQLAECQDKVRLLEDEKGALSIRPHRLPSVTPPVEVHRQRSDQEILEDMHIRCREFESSVLNGSAHVVDDPLFLHVANDIGKRLQHVLDRTRFAFSPTLLSLIEQKKNGSPKEGDYIKGLLGSNPEIVEHFKFRDLPTVIKIFPLSELNGASTQRPPSVMS